MRDGRMVGIGSRADVLHGIEAPPAAFGMRGGLTEMIGSFFGGAKSARPPAAAQPAPPAALTALGITLE